MAGERSSANYTITTDTTDIGGHETTSANYSSIGSAGLISGITNGENETVVKSGYIAQLYSITGLVLDPDLFEINEGSSNSILAYASLDDATFLKLDPEEITWETLSGPISNIDPSGEATAGNVYQTTEAQVQGSWKNYQAQTSFSVLNVGTDDFGLYAGDKLDDAWQVTHFGEENPLAGGDLDPDGDGMKNWEEYLMGTIPTDISSVFSPVANYTKTDTGTHLELSIPTIEGRKYIVKTSSDLNTWNTHEEFNGDGSVKVSTITVLDDQTKFFYRVLVSKE